MPNSPDHISLEPLLNESLILGSIGTTPANVVGQADHRTAITVTSVAQEITMTLGKRTIEIQNTGSKIIHYGGTGVTSSNGIRLFPQQIKTFANVKDDFSIWLVCITAETSEARIVEYD